MWRILQFPQAAKCQAVEGEADFDLETKANPSLNILEENWQGELLHTLSKLYK